MNTKGNIHLLDPNNKALIPGYINFSIGVPFACISARQTHQETEDQRPQKSLPRAVEDHLKLLLILLVRIILFLILMLMLLIFLLILVLLIL